MGPLVMELPHLLLRLLRIKVLSMGVSMKIQCPILLLREIKLYLQEHRPVGLIWKSYNIQVLLVTGR